MTGCIINIEAASLPTVNKTIKDIAIGMAIGNGPTVVNGSRSCTSVVSNNTPNPITIKQSICNPYACASK
ncbi:hypothetical protein VA208B3_12870 [Vibrio alginolyticus]|nr:hypothetical protein VA208B3_12870 [Vibrio alginolyticus]